MEVFSPFTSVKPSCTRARMRFALRRQQRLRHAARAVARPRRRAHDDAPACRCLQTVQRRPHAPQRMSAVFSQRAVLVVRLAVLAVLALSVGVVLLFVWRARAYEQLGEPIAQPIPFSHKHHVGDVGIDCRYCHTTVETDAHAGPAVDRRLPRLSFAALPRPAAARAAARERGAQRPADRVEARPQVAGLRLFRPQHPCGQGRGLHRMPRPRGPDAADAPHRLAADGLVPRLPPRPATAPARRVARVRHGRAAAAAPKTRPARRCAPRTSRASAA